MRTRFVRLCLAAALLAPLALVGTSEAPAYAATETICSTNNGTIKLSPGLEAIPQVQNVVIKGSLAGCSGGTVTSASYVAHLKTTKPIDCETFAAGEGLASGTVVVKWSPKGQGNSHGTLTIPISEVPGSALTGKLENGPMAGLGLYGPVSEAFGSCGTLPEGAKKAKKLKSGTLTGSDLRVTGPPSATIEAPADGGTYTQNAVVSTQFSCHESAFGPGLEACVDSNGASGGTGALETSTIGEHTYSVLAQSIDGQKDRATIHYTVTEA